MVFDILKSISAHWIKKDPHVTHFYYIKKKDNG